MLKKTERQNPVFSLKVSEKTKTQNDNQWFKDYMNYVIPAESAIVEDYDLMKSSYEIANNNLDSLKEKIAAFCNPIGEDIGQINEDLVPYPELHNKINVLKGELLKRPDDFKIVLLTIKAIQDKNDALFEAIKASVDEKLALELERNKALMQGMDKQQVDEYINSLRTQKEPEDLAVKSWQSDIEIFYSKALKYCLFDQDVKSKKLETFEDVLKVDKCFIYSGWEFGRPVLRIRNPLFSIYHKSPNERYVHKGDYFCYKQAITPAELFNTYDLTDDQLNQLGLNNYTTTALDKRHSLGRGSNYVYDKTNQELLMATDNTLVHDKTIGLHQSSARSLNRQSDLIWETHFEFKAFKEVIFLSYIDEYNTEVVTVMPSSFSEFIPKDAVREKFMNRYGVESSRDVWFDKVTGTEYKAERIWIPRKYEIVRLGNDVYPICREVPNQFTNIEDPYGSFELSTKGAIFTARNAKSVSPLQRALPAFIQLIFVKHIENRELAKYIGSNLDIDADTIPDNLGQDADGADIRNKFLTWYAYLKKLGINFYSGSQTSLGGLPPATRSPGSKGMTFDNAMNLFNLQQFIELLKKEIGLAMGVSPQREAMFDTGSNVTDNQQAIASSYNITEPYFYVHNQVWKHAINDWLNNFTTYCRGIFTANPKLKEHSLYYILPNGVEELLRVTPEVLNHNAVGLYVVDSGQNQKYLDTMFNHSFAFAQNGGEGMEAISALTLALVGGASPLEVHKMILIEQEKQRKRQEQLEKMKLDSQERQTKMMVEAREDVQAHEIEKIRVKAEEDRTTDIMTSTIDSLSWNEDKDVDKNGLPDALDVADHFLKQGKLQLDTAKFEHQKEVDEEKLAIDRKKVSAPKISKK